MYIVIFLKYYTIYTNGRVTIRKCFDLCNIINNIHAIQVIQVYHNHLFYD